MTKNHSKPRIVQIACPFCETIIVRAYEYSSIKRDLSDKEPGKITCGTEYLDRCEGHCEHLAFFSDWADAGSRVEKKWTFQVGAIEKALDKSGFLHKSGLNDDLAFSLLNVFTHRDSAQKVLQVMRKAVKGLDIELAGRYVEKGDNVRGSGGPTYMMIFMRPKAIAKTAIKRATRR